MSNGDYIRNMDDDRLSRFLWTWGLNNIVSFIEHGGERLKNGEYIRKWLDMTDFICTETLVDDDFMYDQEFNLK